METLKELKDEVIKDACCCNNVLTKEHLEEKTIEECIANSSPTYRDSYKERLRKIKERN